jgi:hypothetical protein
MKELVLVRNILELSQRASLAFVNAYNTVQTTFNGAEVRRLDILQSILAPSDRIKDTIKHGHPVGI